MAVGLTSIPSVPTLASAMLYHKHHGETKGNVPSIQHFEVEVIGFPSWYLTMTWIAVIIPKICINIGLVFIGSNYLMGNSVTNSVQELLLGTLEMALVVET